MSVRAVVQYLNTLHDYLDKTRIADGIAPLLMRVYLFLPLWEAGINKAMAFDGTVAWFGNPDWGLGMPYPAVMAFLATATELAGSLAILIGFATRWAAIPLMVTMIVAMLTVHIENGWLAISASNSYWFGKMEGAKALAEFKAWAKAYPEYKALVRHGPVVVLNNGIEFAATYFIMLLSLFFTGAGRLSLDAVIAKRFRTSRHRLEFVNLPVSSR